MDVENNLRSPIEHREIPAEESTSSSQAQNRQKGRPLRGVFVGGCLVGLVLFICLGSVIGILVEKLGPVVESQDEWLALGDQFMQAMADKDIDEVQALFTREAGRSFKTSDLAAYVEGPFFALFEGYIDLELESWTINYDSLEGTTVELAGTVNYREGYTGFAEYFVVKEGDAWKLLGFNIEVPPEKFNVYSAVQP